MTGASPIAAWEREPTDLRFTDDATGLPCAMIRHREMRTWCGYIGVLHTHPWHRLAYQTPVKAPSPLINRPVSIHELGAINVFCAAASAKPEQGIWPIDVLVRCHGGITFSDVAYWENEDRASWWFGFDCSHGGDYIPALAANYGLANGVYRDAEYVQHCCAKAAADISLAAKAATRGAAA